MSKRTNKTATPSTEVESVILPVESTEQPDDFAGYPSDDVQVPSAEIEASTTLEAEAEFIGPMQPVVEIQAEQLPEPPAEVIVDMAALPATPVVEAAAPVAPTVTAICEAIRAMGVEKPFDVIATSTTLGLISKSILSKDVDFFRKSFGDKARKLHLRNYAPSYTLETFVEVGLAYHAYKSIVTETNKTAWKAYANPLSYALLGMAVLTGREPGMPNGVYTKIGSSFGKHKTETWAQWFYANETCFASTIKPEPVVEAPAEATAEAATPPVETVADVEAELQAVVAAATKSTKKAGKKAA